MKSKNITIKELFERLVQVEAKIDSGLATDENLTCYFKKIVCIIIGAEVFNAILNVILIILHQYAAK